MERIEDHDTPAVNPRRAHFNAGTAKDASGASFAQHLRAWWYTQKLFAKQEDFAVAIGVSIDGLRLWLTGRAFPGDLHCDALFSFTQLDCFSPAGRGAARLEHEQKRGLSRAGKDKQARRQFILDEEMVECIEDIRKAFTIRGDDWIICLGRKTKPCGRMLHQLKAEGAGAHLKEHDYKTNGEYLGEWEYNKGTALVCNALAAKRREQAAAGGYLKPEAGRGYLRPPAKGRKLSREAGLNQAGRRDLKGSRDLDRDARILRLSLLESRSIEEISEQVRLSRGRIHVILRRVFGAPLNDRVLFSRGELTTKTWVNRLCDRFGRLSKLQLGRLSGASGPYLQDLSAAEKDRALTPDQSEPLASIEGKFLEVIANAEGDSADYLRAGVPDLKLKHDGAVSAIKLVRDVATGDTDLAVGLKEFCGAAQDGNVEARTALAWLPRIHIWFLTVDETKRRLPPSELARIFLPEEFRTNERTIREALSRIGPVETKPGAIRHMIVTALPEKKQLGRVPIKTAVFREARQLHQNEKLSWPKIAKRLDPKAYAEDPRKAGEAMRQGVRSLKHVKTTERNA